MAAHSKLAGPVRVTKIAKRPTTKDKNVVSKQSDYVTKHAGKHEILDEFSRLIVTRAGTVVKPARRFGKNCRVRLPASVQLHGH